MKHLLFFNGIIALFLLLFSIRGISQDFTNVLPESPQVFALGKYIDVPVGYHTGVPNINVPIYTLKENEFELPISFSYHASGIQVEQEATWAGLGWTLNAGGMISRSLLGLEDKAGGRGEEPLNWQTFDGPAGYNYYYNMVVSPTIDPRPDIFYYNFNGHIGKFILDNQGVPMLLEKKNISIKVLNTDAAIEGWELIMEDGTKYIFGTSDDYLELKYGSYSKGGNSSTTPQHISGWYLKEIILLNGRNIQFNYSDNGIVTSSGSYIAEYYFSAFGSAPSPASVQASESSSTTIKRLSSIEGTHARIEFEAQKLREDINGSNTYALTKIKIFNTSGLLDQYFDINTDYFQNSSGDNYNIKRLKLNSIQQYSSDGTKSVPAWMFEYNETMLPSKHSTAQDMWGYYNGQIGNTNLIPIVKTTLGQADLVRNCNQGAATNNCGFLIQTPLNVNVGMANRDTDANYIEACILTDIIYPTGGRTEYFYEPNNYSYIGNKGSINENKDAGGLRVREIHQYYEDNSYLKSTYKYKILDVDGVTETSLSSGVLNNDPEFYYLQAAPYRTDSDPAPDWVDEPYLVVTNKPAKQLALTLGSPVGYRQVKVEKISNNSQNNGSETYSYTSGFEYPDIFGVGIPGYAVNKAAGSSEKAYYYGYSWADHDCCYKKPNFTLSQAPFRGLLKEKSAYDTDNVLLKRTVNEYLFEETFSNVHDYEPTLTSMYSSTFLGTFETGVSFFMFPIHFFNPKLSATDNYDYFKGNINHTREEYTYNHDQLVLQKTYDSQDREIIRKFKYPLDYVDGVSPIIDGMKNPNNNVIGPVIEEQNWVETSNGEYSLVSGKLTEYGSNYLPSSIHSLETDLPLTDADFGEIYSNLGPYNVVFPEGGNYYKKKVDIRYETSGSISNLKEIDKKNDIITAYIWSLSNIFPVVKGENIDHSTLESAVTSAMSSVAGYSTIDDLMDALVGKMHGGTGNLRSTWDAFNIALRSKSNLADAQINTYTYDPLVGMTSQTDPAGVTTYYEYDDFGRLEYLKDDEGHVLKHYQYHYAE